MGPELLRAQCTICYACPATRDKGDRMLEVKLSGRVQRNEEILKEQTSIESEGEIYAKDQYKR